MFAAFLVIAICLKLSVHLIRGMQGRNLNAAKRVAQPALHTDTITTLDLAIETCCTLTLQILDHTNEHVTLDPPKGCLSREEIFRLNLHCCSELDSSYP